MCVLVVFTSVYIVFFKQKTAYEMRISDWSSEVCSSDLGNPAWAGDQDKALGDRIGAFRHVRSFAIDAVHKGTSPFIGARELWWPTLSDFERGVAGDRAAFDALLAQAGQHYTMLASAERVI